MISLVAAMTRQRVIGKYNGLPWHIKSEVDHFRDIIRAKTLIMGRNTFDIMKGHLESAHNIVITHRRIDVEGVDSFANLEEALSKSRTYSDDVFIVGGQSIFEQSIGIADMMQISYIKADYKGNKLFPEFDQNEWYIENKEDFPEFEYIIYIRKQAK
jgi:dihydrofolate reductase